MKIICISTREASGGDVIGITLDKMYHVYDEDAMGYRIINDKGAIGMYWKGRFRIATAESRNEILEKLGI